MSVTNGDVKELLPLGLGLGTDVQWGQSPPRLHSCAFGADSELCCASRGEELLVFDLTTRSMLCCLRGADAHLISCALTARHMAQVAAAGVSAAGAIFCGATSARTARSRRCASTRVLLACRNPPG